MTNSGEPSLPSDHLLGGNSNQTDSSGSLDTPLQNLYAVRVRMDSLQRFLSDSVNSNTLIGESQMAMVSSEIESAIHQIIVNGAALLAGSWKPNPPPPVLPVSGDLTDPSDLSVQQATEFRFVEEEANLKIEEEISELDGEIVELDAMELLAEHIHICNICGKGFKRDANLRMHMRAHGNQFKTLEALAKPQDPAAPPPELGHKVRFSCPYEGCKRNKKHKKFRAMKSVICVKNHFKRSHCPKMYSCDRCHKKSFSVVADLKSHLKHCGESKWRCSCGTSFSRKDKLFGHMALFEGHMPAVADEDDKAKGLLAMEEDEEDDEDLGMIGCDDGIFEGLLDGFCSIENYCLQDMLELQDL